MGKGFGGDGAIYLSIDRSGDGRPIGECDNASKVIEYVVLYGTKYYSTPLVDMRIHDINIVADPIQATIPRKFQQPSFRAQHPSDCMARGLRS